VLVIPYRSDQTNPVRAISRRFPAQNDEMFNTTFTEQKYIRRVPKNSRLPLKERELKGIIELKSLLFPFKKGRN